MGLFNLSIPLPKSKNQKKVYEKYNNKMALLSKEYFELMKRREVCLNELADIQKAIPLNKAERLNLISSWRALGGSI